MIVVLITKRLSLNIENVDLVIGGDRAANINLMCGDCLELMKQIPDKSVDMILCDLPY